MSNNNLSRRTFLAATAGLAASPFAIVSAADLESQFRDVPNPARMRMHWYVFGPAWTAEDSERQLQLMADAHIGGVLLFPTYPIAIDKPAEGILNQQFLSPEYLDVLRSVAGACQRNGLTLDMVLGTGWPYGGPSVSLEQSAHSLRLARVTAGAAGAWNPPALRDGEKVIASFTRGPEGPRPVRPGEA